MQLDTLIAQNERTSADSQASIHEVRHRLDAAAAEMCERSVEAGQHPAAGLDVPGRQPIPAGHGVESPATTAALGPMRHAAQVPTPAGSGAGKRCESAGDEQPSPLMAVLFVLSATLIGGHVGG